MRAERPPARATYARRRVRGLQVLVAGALALTLLVPARAEQAASCTAAQKRGAQAALARYRKAMPKQRAAYFRTHKRAAQRKLFVKRQQARLRVLRARAACSVPRRRAPARHAAAPARLGAGERSDRDPFARRGARRRGATGCRVLGDGRRPPVAGRGRRRPTAPGSSSGSGWPCSPGSRSRSPTPRRRQTLSPTQPATCYRASSRSRRTRPLRLPPRPSSPGSRRRSPSRRLPTTASTSPSRRWASGGRRADPYWLPSTGTLRGLIVPVDFADAPASTSVAFLRDYLVPTVGALLPRDQLRATRARVADISTLAADAEDGGRVPLAVELVRRGEGISCGRHRARRRRDRLLTG